MNTVNYFYLKNMNFIDITIELLNVGGIYNVKIINEKGGERISRALWSSRNFHLIDCVLREEENIIAWEGMWS